MTKQASDYVWYNGEKYTLIDCEKDKSVIDSANFGLENKYFGTACRRGYTAEYFIENNLLFGEKTVWDAERTKNSIVISHFTSSRMRMSYTGSMIIAINNDGSFSGLGFITDYLKFDRALELYFIDGELAEITDLSAAIKEWAAFKKNNDYDQEREIALKHLQYDYGINYKNM